jgi:hypothetical protein
LLWRENIFDNRVVCKVSQENMANSEMHHFLWLPTWVSSGFDLFFLSASIVATYIFTAPTCTTTIITLEPCALNAEFHHFIIIPRFYNKTSLLCGPHSKKEGIGGWKEAQKRGWKQDYFMENSNMSKDFMMDEIGPH